MTDHIEVVREARYDDGWASIYNADFRAVEMDDESVDLIFTDPPYPRQFIPLYGDMAAQAARALKPGGSVIAYCGHFALPDVISAMSEHLSYYWIIQCVHPGSMAWMSAYNIKASWKPVVWFKKPPLFPPLHTVNVVDRVKSPRAKTHGHPWEQGVEGVDIIQALAPGGTVYDPFMGTGTTLVAAKIAGAKRAIGCELDATHVETAISRVAQEVLAL